MAVARTARHRWIDEGLQALAAGGPDAVQIESLARTLGVSKGGFYGYFADRRALLDEVLDTWESRSTERVIEQVEHEGGDAMAGRGGPPSSPSAPSCGRSTSRSATGPAGTPRSPSACDASTTSGSPTCARCWRPVCADDEDLEARCLIAFSVAIADRLIAADHGTRTRSDVRKAVRRQLFTPAEGSPVVLADRGDGSLPSGG